MNPVKSDEDEHEHPRSIDIGKRIAMKNNSKNRTFFIFVERSVRVVHSVLYLGVHIFGGGRGEEESET